MRVRDMSRNKGLGDRDKNPNHTNLIKGDEKIEPLEEGKRRE